MGGERQGGSLEAHTRRSPQSECWRGCKVKQRIVPMAVPSESHSSTGSLDALTIVAFNSGRYLKPYLAVAGGIVLREITACWLQSMDTRR